MRHMWVLVRENLQDLAFYSLDFLLVNQKVILRIAWRKGAEVLILEWKMHFQIEFAHLCLKPWCVLVHPKWWHKLVLQSRQSKDEASPR